MIKIFAYNIKHSKIISYTEILYFLPKEKENFYANQMVTKLSIKVSTCISNIKHITHNMRRKQWQIRLVDDNLKHRLEN